jgi:integrase
VILASDIARQVIPEPTFDLNLARKTLREAPLTDRATDLFPAIHTAIHTLKDRLALRREIFIVTDGQSSGWRQLIEIQKLPDIDKRDPYPLSWEEQRLLFSELPIHLADMALFKVNTGTREQEVVNLKWEWEIQIPELKTSVFVIPKEFVKNGADRLVVLNRVARSVVSAARGKHESRVFTFQGRPVTRMINSAWKKARKRAANRYEEQMGEPCPYGFRNIRVHDLKHTYGRRLRAAGVGFEDRQDLLGHRSGRVTTHYSAAELRALIAASEKACGKNPHKSPTLTLIRTRREAVSCCVLSER